MRNNSNSNSWFSIKAKNNSCQGYMPAESKKEACKKFGLKSERCFVKSVIWNGKEFVEVNQVKQGRLFSLS